MDAPRPIKRVVTPTSHNGLLLYVPGDLIANGSATLPKPSLAEHHQPERLVEIDVPTLGHRVRITYRLQKYKCHRDIYWRWSAEWADAVE